jgi:hypothetical protein
MHRHELVIFYQRRKSEVHGVESLGLEKKWQNKALIL